MSDSASVAGSDNLASPVKRLLGYLIDMGVAFGLLLLKKPLGYAALYAHTATSLMLFQYASSALTLFAIGYLLFCDALPQGQSLGKRVCRTAVVGYPYPTNCTVVQSFLRNLPKLLLSVLDGMFVLMGLRRRLGDMLAKTVVINT